MMMLYNINKERIAGIIAELQERYIDFFLHDTTQIVSLIEKENIEVAYFDKKDIEDNIHGKVEENIKRQQNRYKIFIREDDAYCLQRFVLAHELGHLLLQHERPKYFRVKKEDLSLWNSDICELEANLFAIQILMKDDLFRIAYKKTNDINELSRIFMVPEKAVCMKIDFLNL